MFESIFENLSRPIIASFVLSVDNMNHNGEFALISIIFEDINRLSLGNVLVLNAEASLNITFHLFSH